MIKEVKFQGLCHSPSEHDGKDGELGACLNLIPEDGALKPISAPSVAESFKLPNDSCSIKFVHKVAHGSDIHSHYIVNCSNGSPYKWYWTEKGGDGTKYEIDLGDFEVKSVTAIGNVVCFVGEDSVKYAYWSYNDYKIYSRKDFSYNFSIDSECKNEKVYVDFGDDRSKYYNYESDIFTIKKAQVQNCLSLIDSYTNKLLSEEYSDEWMKHIVFGVVAVKLYDGSYYNISNIFILPIKTYQFANFVATTKGIYTGVSIGKHSITIKSNELKNNELVDRIDVFLSNGDFLIDTDKDYEQKGAFPFLSYLENKDLLKRIDGLSYYLSTSIEKEDFGNPITLNRIKGTETSLSLADLYRIDFGSKCGFVYNNRLHLGGTNYTTPDFNNVNYEYRFSHLKDGGGEFFSKCIDYPILDGQYAPDYAKRDVAILVKPTRGSAFLIQYESTYPIPPIITLPFNIDGKATIIMEGDAPYPKYYSDVDIYNSNNTGYSILIPGIEYKTSSPFRFHQSKKPIYNPADNTYISNNSASVPDGWKYMLDYEYKHYYDIYKTNRFYKVSSSLIKVSDAENPLVFQAKNSVQVGSSVIRALACNTRPISEGQFGDAPLYAFTDEGVWVLTPSTEGTYVARQPANRDICSNPSGILQIDDAVLFPTERGVMLQEGRTSRCITDSLDGYPMDFTTMYKESFADKVLAVNGTDKESVRYAYFRKFMEKADMIYDYYDSRIILFNPDYKYAYAYSIKSGMWGAMYNYFSKRVNIYPESYAVDRDNNIINVYDKSPSKDTPYFLCSRPLTLDLENIHKTMFSCIARGYFGAESGKCGIVLYGSNDLQHWQYIKSSVNKYLRGMAGSPYKYFKVAMIGNLSPNESISGISTDIQERWSNKLR